MPRATRARRASGLGLARLRNGTVWSGLVWSGRWVTRARAMQHRRIAPVHNRSGARIDTGREIGLRRHRREQFRIISHMLPSLAFPGTLRAPPSFQRLNLLAIDPRELFLGCPAPRKRRGDSVTRAMILIECVSDNPTCGTISLIFLHFLQREII